MLPGLDGLRFSHWQAARREDGIVVLALDRQDAAVNALSQDVLIELGDIVERLAIDPPKGVVFRSAKPSGFIAGAAKGQGSGPSTVTCDHSTLATG